MPTPPPWKPGYATPRYIKKEPLERGARVTAMLPRGTIFTGGSVVTPGYALPGYVKREPLGRGVFVTKQLPRGTGFPVLSAAPAGASSLGSLAGSSLGGSSLGGSSLSGSARGKGVSRSKDPFLGYGEKTASVILSSIGALPAADRKRALELTLEKIQPGLWGTVEQKVTAFAAKGLTPAESLRRAMVASLANGLSSKVIELGEEKASFGSLGALTAAQQMDIIRKGPAPVSVLDIIGGVRVHTGAQDYSTVVDGRTYKGVRWTGGPNDGQMAVMYMVDAPSAGWEAVAKAMGPTVSKKFKSYTGYPDGSMVLLKTTNALAGGHNIGSFDGSSFKDHAFYLKLYKKNADGSFSQISTPSDVTKLARRAIVIIHKEAPDKSAWDKISAVGGKLLDIAATVTGAGIVIDKVIVPIVKKTTQVVGKVVEKAYDTATDLACMAVNNGSAQAIGAGVAAANGAPPQVGAAGVAIAQQVCGGGPQYVAPPPPPPLPILPIALAGVGLLALFFVLKDGS